MKFVGRVEGESLMWRCLKTLSVCLARLFARLLSLALTGARTCAHRRVGEGGERGGWKVKEGGGGKGGRRGGEGEGVEARECFVGNGGCKRYG